MFSRSLSSAVRLQTRRASTAVATKIPRASTTCTHNLSSPPRFQQRRLSTLEGSFDATDAWKKSCYFQIDYTINQECTVYEAIQRFAAFDIGCLVTVDDIGDITGVISERDYIGKMALLGRDSKVTKVKEIATTAANLVTARQNDSLEVCLSKVLSKEIRHLPILDNDNKVVGMISVKDLVKSVIADREAIIKTLEDFSTGRGGHFVD